MKVVRQNLTKKLLIKVGRSSARDKFFNLAASRIGIFASKVRNSASQLGTEKAHEQRFNADLKLAVLNKVHPPAKLGPHKVTASCYSDKLLCNKVQKRHVVLAGSDHSSVALAK